MSIPAVDGRPPRGGFWWTLLATSAAFLAAASILWGVVWMAYSWAARTSGFASWNAILEPNTTILLGNPYSLLTYLALGLAGPPAIMLAARIHRVDPASFIAPFGAFSWLVFWRVAGATFATTAPFMLLSIAIYGDEMQWSFRLFANPLFLAAIVAVIAIQTLAEELLFRGYLFVAWLKVFPYPVAVTLAWSAVFTALHIWNPDVQRDPVPALIALFAFALVTQWLVVRTGSVDGAWGMHFANNIIALLLVNIRPGYNTDAPLIQITDPIYAAGGSYIADLVSWGIFLLSYGVTFWLLLDRRSPFFIAGRR